MPAHEHGRQEQAVEEMDNFMHDNCQPYRSSSEPAIRLSKRADTQHIFDGLRSCGTASPGIFVIDHSADGLTFHSSSNAQTILALWAKANIEEYAMELDSHEISLLKCLADEWIKSGPPGLVETAMIAKSLDMTIPDTRSTIHTLFVKGLVGTDKYDLYAAYLTPEGFDIARSNGPDDDGGPDA